MDLSDNAWFGITQSAIAAGAGLLGVLIGGWITASNQQRERRHARIRQQLEEFYSPMRGIVAEIRAKSEIRQKIHAAGNQAWQKKLDDVDDPLEKKMIQNRDWPRFEKIIDYGDEQLRKELVPLYQRLLTYFKENMWLAEQSTLAHYAYVVEFVEIWKRFLSDSFPTELLEFIEHKESTLKPLYQDIEENFSRLTKELKRRW